MEASAEYTNAKLQEIIRKVKRIEGMGRMISRGSIAGEYKSVFRSNGIEFDQVREYSDQDDSRMIDWNVTARLDAPYVKTFMEERDLNIYFLVDVSASGEFSSGERSKRDVAAEIVATVGINALSRNDRISLLLFTDHTEQYLPPGKGRKNLWRLLREVLFFEPEEKQTSINDALVYFSKIRHTPGVVFVISDFHDTGFETMLKKIAVRNTVILAKITDEIEFEFPNAGIIEFTDSETGETRLIDTADFNWRQSYSLSKEALLAHGSKSIDLLEIGTNDNVDRILRNFFHRKMLRR